MPPLLPNAPSASRAGNAAARPATPSASAAPDVRNVFLRFPGTKDIRLHPVFRGSLSRWGWRFYTHRLTRSGHWLMAVTLLMGMSIVPSLDVQFFIPLLYVLALWVVTILVVALNRPQATVASAHAPRICAGEILPVEVTVHQPAAGRGGWRRGGFDLNVLPERLPLEVDAAPPSGVPVGTLRSRETRVAYLGLSCPRRGVYKLWGYRLESDFPFGLMNAYRTYSEPRTLTVFPRFEPLDRMDLPVGRRYQPGGMLLASHLGDSFEYLGNREYREGDNIRDIDWRTTARHGGAPIALREYREEFFLRVGLVLDTHLSRRGTPRERAAGARALENAVSVCAAIGDYVARKEYIVDLFAAGPDLFHLTAGRQLAYLDQILDILACIQGTPAEPLEIVAPQLQAYLARLTTVICVFLHWDETRRLFVEGLRASGAGVKVILIEAHAASDGESASSADPVPGDVQRLTPEELRAGVREL